MAHFAGSWVRVVTGWLLLAGTVGAARGQQVAGASSGASWIARYQALVSATQSRQPHWITPLVTVTPRLEQEVRADFVRQINAKHYSTWNLDNGKGLELIPASRIELLFNVPPFLDHTQPGSKDGFGDVTFLMKFRVFARNEDSGNRILTAFLGASVPTGKNGNGGCCAVVTPTLAGGKGFGRFDVTSTLGGSLPVTNAKGLGHTAIWNNVAQYRTGKTGMARLFWPEFEINSSFYSGGSDDGKIMSFATPGLVIGRVPLSHNAAGEPGRLGLTFGAGEQIALTHFHTYNHALVLTARIPF
jgi:hypothetical protein